MGRFPRGFLWGAATAAYQIEGSPLADGAGASNWHRFAHTPGTIARGENGDVAADSYRRWRDDVALLGELGLGAYRFSIAWSRVLPDGLGRVNRAGLDHYERLVDALCAAGIAPFVTLHHWDLPGALQDRGGWAERDCASWFADYTEIVVARLADRVQHWITLNEPASVTYRGYMTGEHAPGMRDGWAALRAAQHMMLGHGRAVVAARAAGASQIGITLVSAAVRAATDATADADAARRFGDLLYGLFFDPVFHGAYADGPRTWFGPEAWPEPSDEDMAVIATPIDFLGLNYYYRASVAHDDGGGPLRLRVFPARDGTTMGWESYPNGLVAVLAMIRDRYGGPPVYITENGAACDDAIVEGGTIQDLDRIEYLAEHIAAAGRAVDSGADVRGYFVWSLLDNFEWAHGYDKRFGLVRVDAGTGARVAKRSAAWYRDFIALERSPRATSTTPRAARPPEAPRRGS